MQAQTIDSAHPEVRISRRPVGVMQVVGKDSKGDELFAQLSQHPRVVIHPAEQNRLVQHREPPVDQSRESAPHRGRQFSWMVGMDQDPDRGTSPKPGDEIRCDTVRGGDGRPGVHAYDGDLRAHRIDDPEDPSVSHSQRVATAQNELTRTRATDPLHGGPELLCRGVLDAPAVTTPKAIAAVQVTAAREKEQHTIGVFLDQPRARLTGPLTYRIVQVQGIGEELLRVRERLDGQRIARTADRLRPGRWHPYRKGRIRLTPDRIGEPTESSQSFRSANHPGGSIPDTIGAGFGTHFSQEHLVAVYQTSDFRNGLKVVLDGEPFVMTYFQFVKPGKGTAFTRTKLKSLISGNVIERTYRTGESLQVADCEDVTMQYQYNDGDTYYFMSMESFETIPMMEERMDGAEKYLLDSLEVQIILFDGNPISIQLPNFIEAEITYCEPGVRGNTAQGATKPATLSTGASVNVPLFVDQGEVIRVDTRTGDYVNRVRK